MSNIVKELEKTKSTEFAEVEGNDVIKEVKLLMDGDQQEDLRIFRALGNHHSIAVSESELGKKLELEKLDSVYHGGVFTTGQIKKLAVKYNLRFLPTNLYTGKMDVQVAAKIKQFSKDTDTIITDGAIRYNFRILAPEQSFKLRGERTRKFWEDKDPAIFYKIDETHYRLIHKWGADFTIQNRIKGLQNQSFLTAWLTNFIVHLPVMFLLAFLLDKLAGSHLMSQAYFWPVLLATMVYSFLCQAGRLENVVDQNNSFYSDVKWNSEIKLR